MLYIVGARGMPMEDRRSIELGRLVTRWRKEAGLSQAALADALGTQQATVSKLETGAYRLTVVQLLSILEACGLSLGDVSHVIEAAAGAADRPIWERVDE